MWCLGSQLYLFLWILQHLSALKIKIYWGRLCKCPKFEKYSLKPTQPCFQMTPRTRSRFSLEKQRRKIKVAFRWDYFPFFQGQLIHTLWNQKEESAWFKLWNFQNGQEYLWESEGRVWNNSFLHLSLKFPKLDIGWKWEQIGYLHYVIALLFFFNWFLWSCKYFLGKII